MTSPDEGEGRAVSQWVTKDDNGRGVSAKSDITTQIKIVVSFQIISIGMVLRKDHV